MRATRIFLLAGVLALALAATALAAPKIYVLKHPMHENCKAHYVKKSRTVKVHGHNVKQTVCQYVAPKSTSPVY